MGQERVIIFVLVYVTEILKYDKNSTNDKMKIYTPTYAVGNTKSNVLFHAVFLVFVKNRFINNFGCECDVTPETTKRKSFALAD